MTKTLNQNSLIAKQKKLKFNKEDQRLLALWAADCAEHVLAYFEKEFPQDDRPRKAIEACRAWAQTGIFKMTDIRGASLAAHAAARATLKASAGRARKAPEDSAARFAARAAGQAVATAHVATHAFGAAWYGAKAAKAAGAEGEEEWQSQRLPAHLRYVLMK